MSEKAVELQNIGFSYSKSKKFICDLNVVFESNSVNVLYGHNGSGKTTLLKLICGILKHSCGRINLFGRDISLLGNRERAKTVSYMPQMAAFDKNIPLSSSDVIGLGYHAVNGWFNYNRKAKIESIKNLCARMGILELLGKPIGSLSAGQFKKVNLARVFLQDSRIVLLDEPTAHLDGKTMENFYSLLKEFKQNNKTILLVVHSKEDVPDFCDRVVNIEEGRLVC